MKRSLLLSALIFSLFTTPWLFAGQGVSSGSIMIVRLDSPINPLAVRYLDLQIKAAARDGAAMLVVELMASEGYSASVVRASDLIRSSTVPLVVWAPTPSERGSPIFKYLRAASGDAFRETVANAAPRSIDALLASLDGRTFNYHGKTLTVHTSGASTRTSEMNGLARILSHLLDPTLAYVLLLLGVLGIAVEFSLPGVGFPGVTGGLSLLISLVALGALSVNVGGLLIILLALALFIFDIKAPTHGILTAGGVIALLIGSLLLFPGREALPGVQQVRISPIAIASMTALLTAVLLTAVFVGASASRRKVTVGKETLIGLSGVALTEVDPEGLVRVANEEWSATSVGDQIRKGDEVDVVDVQGVHLVVMRRL